MTQGLFTVYKLELVSLLVVFSISGCYNEQKSHFQTNCFVSLSSPASQIVNQHISSADSLLDLSPIRIIDKPENNDLTAPRNYISLATYWWPDPGIPDGLPYIRRDGFVNPESISEKSDLSRLIEMSQRIELLADAYVQSGDDKYARQAIEQLNVWFVDEENAMYPHLEHAQMIRGLNQGRSYGVIDTWWLIRVIESYPHLKRSKYWNIEVETGLRAWFTHYLNWLRNSEFGQKEMQSKNNHGTWYDLQVVTFARFVGQDDFARDYLLNISVNRIARQVTISGRQRYELRRPRPLHYSIYNLSGLMKLAEHGNELSVDLVNMNTFFSGSLKDAFCYLMNQMDGVDSEKLMDPKDKTETDRLYDELIRSAGILFAGND